MNGLRVIPLCHSGQRVAELPPPLLDFQGVGLDEDDAPKRLLAGVADGFGIKHPEALDFRDMAAKRAAATGIKMAAPTPPRSKPDLPKDQQKILTVLGLMADLGMEEVPLRALPMEARVKPSAFKFHIDELNERQYAHIDYLTTGEHEVRLMPAGSRWLIEHEPEVEELREFLRTPPP